MTITAPADLYWDPYNVEIFKDPYPVFRRLRDEAPLYRNEAYDFYAVSRFEDAERVLVDREHFLSCRGDILEMVQSGVDIPPGTLIFEEAPVHTTRRGLLSRVFTPKHMFELEPKVRDLCRRRLDMLVGRDQFDFVADIGEHVPMRVIGMLLGIPENDQEMIRDVFLDETRGEPGLPKDYSDGSFTQVDMFSDYVDWRYEHPSDDLMTVLINAEFEDENGAIRLLTKDEILTYVTVLAGAGNETTNRLISWIGKVLGDHPDARRELVRDRSLVPNAIEEIFRYETIVQLVARYVGRDFELHGRTVPAGSAIVAIQGSANRDEREFPDPDHFDIHRQIGHHLAFGYGPHYCLGAALARVEGRVVLDEILNRFPNWEVDDEHTELIRPGNNRAWEKMPVFIG